MDILEKKSNDIQIITLGGRMDAYSSNDVERQLNSLIEANQVKIILNLTGLEYISSSGLRVLLAALKKSRKASGDIRLAGMRPYVKEVFDIAGFTQLFKIFDQEEAAIDSFK
jgi:anti-sigma B factor antagonist